MRNITWKSEGVPPSDVALIEGLIKVALTDLSQEFCEEGGIDLLSDLSLTVYIHCGEGSEAQMNTTVISGKPHATLELLTPSCIPAGAQTMVGEPKDKAYFHKIAVHELSMLFLWQVTRHKACGWSFFSGPDWLVDGWEEFLALTRSSDHSRVVTLPLYRERVVARWAYGVPQDMNRYLDGAIIIEFMHHQFGREAMSKLLRASEEGFSKALRAVLHVDERLLFEACRQWLRSREI